MTETVDIALMLTVLLVLGLPLLVFVLCLPAKNKDLAAPLAASVSLVVLLLVGTMASQFYSGNEQYVKIPWFQAGYFIYHLGFLIDKLSLVMLGVAALITLLVNIFSLEYMKHDPARHRYYALLGLFAFSMYGIVLSSNLLMTFVFWELAGFSSYLLIGFWFHNEEPPKASLKAFIVNRVGDGGFLLALFILFVFFKSFELPYLWEHFSNFGQADPGIGISESLLTLMGLGLFLGAAGKSAQFPLQTWLPAAMAAPTPVSALIHAATMVAAGVFMMLRVFPLFNVAALDVIATVGTITAFMAAFAAFAQHDIKKVLAFSTLSQLGFMVMSIGVGAPDAAFFHLVTHAFFKASLFLCAGSVIHFLRCEKSPQNMLEMGGMRKALPFTFIAYTLSMLAICGLPFFSGYLSKEAMLAGVLEWTTRREGTWRAIVPLMAFVSIFMTAAYMGRQYFLVFFGKAKWHAEPGKESWKVYLPVLLLAALSLWIFYSFNPFRADTFLMQILSYPIDTGHSVNATLLGLVSCVLAIGGLYTAYVFFHRQKGAGFLQAVSDRLGGLSANHWYLDDLHRVLVIQPVRHLSSWFFHFDKKYIDGIVDAVGLLHVLGSQLLAWFDRHVVDGAVTLITRLTGYIGHITRSIQNGRAQTYLVWAVLGIILILATLYKI